MSTPKEGIDRVVQSPDHERKIDLPNKHNFDDRVDSSQGVTLDENLPVLSPEDWSDTESFAEDEFNDQASGSFYSSASSPEMTLNSAEGRWEFIMKKLISIENNTTSLREDFSHLSDKVDSHSVQLQQVKSSVTSLAGEVATHEKKLVNMDQKQQAAMATFDQQMGQKFKMMETNFKLENERFQQALLQETNKKIEGKIQESAGAYKDGILQGQCEQRKLNLIFVGLAENDSKTDLQILNDFLSESMNIKEAGITSAYRLGNLGGNKPRPILARFIHIGRRNKVWFSKASIKQGKNKIWLQEDLPKLMKNTYRSLYTVLRKAKSMGDRFQGAQIIGQSIIIDDKPYRVEDLENLPDVLRPSNLASRQSESVYVFFGRASPFSNHHHSPFTIEDISFQCMEQYLAWRRAKLADRQDLVDKSLQKADPLVYKSILNSLHSANIEEWHKDLPDTALVGLRAKFGQNPPLGLFLCNTHPKMLGEASQNKRWGVGFTLIQSEVLDMQKWLPEGNLLGKTLMFVREELIAEKNV